MICLIRGVSKWSASEMMEVGVERLFISVLLSVVLAAGVHTSAQAAPPARCVKWDCFLHPVTVTASSTPEPGRWIRWAFDGYPTKVSDPLAREHWRCPAPAKDKPEVLTVDYGKPIAATRFVHYYEGIRPPSAWRDVDIQSSTDNQTWSTIASFSGLRADYPQVLAIDKPTHARYYRFIIRSLADGATAIATHEIETYRGASIGSVDAHGPVQSEPFELKVRVSSPDADLSGASLKLVAPKGCLQGETGAKVPSVSKGAAAVVSLRITPLQRGPLPMIVEMRAGGSVIDRRPCTLIVQPKLEIADLTPDGAVVASANRKVSVRGTVRNSSRSVAKAVKVSWMGKSKTIGDLAAGKSASFEITATAKPGYSEGAVVATDSGLGRTVVRRPVICRSAGVISVGGSRFTAETDRTGLSLHPAGSSGKVTGGLLVITPGKPCPLAVVGPAMMAAAVPGGVFIVNVAERGDIGAVELKCEAVPNDPNPVDPPWLDLELRLAVDNPKIMFRPHIDWYTVEHGPNVPGTANGHHSATRMICIQTPDSTVSMVPDTDTMQWGFTGGNEMTALFQMSFGPQDPLGQHVWRAINYAPTRFNTLLPVRKGDWWEAYRHVTRDIFHFEQPRQWAMPITQMQMHNARYIMRYEVWSERWQTVRSFPNADVFFNFYGTTYTLPALYSWYLATDCAEAKVKAEKVLDWLLGLQEKEGFAAGCWFSQYAAEGDKLVGRDQAGNRWIVPHSTGTAAKTLLWYWNASGRTNDRVFQAAKRACDWLVSIQRPDGGWSYAFDLEGKPLTELPDAGQIWCTWALWQMGKITGEAKYTQAALKSKDAFVKTFVNVHRYMGYWEDVSGGGGNVTRSWEAYEPAIAALVFTEMGDRKLAAECAKDAATWSWTRVTSTRQYETCYGETTEQSLCGPAQAQSPMVAVGLHQIYENTGDAFWNDFSGAIKAINFCGDPDQGYGMCATTGWFDPTCAVAGPPFDNVRPWITAGNSRNDEYGRGVWAEWQTSQFAWLALEWLIREANVRAPEFVKIDPNTLKGTVLGAPGRIKMPEERCDVVGVDHYDINWVGYYNDAKFALLVMNHKERTRVMIRPHEAHLDIYTRPPRIMIGKGKAYAEAKVTKQGINYVLDIPAGGNALLVWDRIK